jgi:hypothetical protein
MAKRNWLLFGCSLASVACIAPGPAAAGEAIVAHDNVSQDMLALELALMHKTKADELFIGGALADARKNYEAAAADLGDELELDPSADISLKLLRADLKYRTLLLDRGLSFWGAVQTLRPTAPSLHLRRMEALVEQYRVVNAEIEAEAARSQDGDIKSAELQAQVVARESEFRQEGVESERINAQETFTLQQQDRLDGRIDGLHAQRKVLENQLAAAVSQARAASAALNGLIADAAMASIGIPPDVARAVQNRQWDRAVLSLVSQELAASPAFQSALADLDNSVLKAAETIREGEEILRQGQEAVATVKAVRSALRDPTLENLTTIGAQVYNRLPETTRREWGRKIQEFHPAAGLVEMMNAVENVDLAKNLRASATRYLSENVGRAGDLLRTEISDQIKHNLDTIPNFDLARQQADLIAAAAAVATRAADQRMLVDQMGKTWPQLFIQSLPDRAVSQVLGAAGLATPEQLVDRLSATGLTGLTDTIKVEGGTITIVAGNDAVATIPLTAFLELPKTARIEHVADQATNKILATTDALQESGSLAVRQVLLDTLPSGTVERAVQAVLQSSNDSDTMSEAAWNRIAGQLTPQHQQLALASLVQADIGSLVVADRANKTNAAARAEAEIYDPSGGAQSGASAQSRMTEAAVKMAMNAVFPGASVAASAFASFNNFNDAIDRAQRLAAQLQQNIAEELQVIDLVGEARLKREVLRAELEVSRLAQESARAQHSIFATAIQIGADARFDQKRKILARRSLAFYINERMRSEFDALERSITLWTGRGTIASRVRSEPQYIRLALDQDIHLYDWLNRSGEGRRADIDGLVVHWQQMVQLAKRDCQMLGCDDGDADLGKIKETELIRLTDLLSEPDRERLRQWQHDRGRDPLALPIAIGLDGRLATFGIDPDWENVRVVEVRLGRKIGSQMAKLTAMSLSHPGSGYIRRGGEMVREALLPDEFPSFDKADNFDVEELRRRFLVDRPKLNQFEGYPFYSSWMLTLLPNQENWAAGDQVLFRFALQYTGTSTISLESDFLARAGLPAPDNLSPGAYRYSARWSNGLETEARVTIDGATRRIAIPRAGQIELRPEQVAALFNPLPSGAQPAPPSAGRVEIVRSCRPNADLRSFLREQIAGTSAAGTTGAELRRETEAKLAALGGADCAERIVPIQESRQ